MSGKAYTMREMKIIVEYLTEHRAYGEIKGRKMWMDFANSKITSRTWQSLKETFLKRILPDIHNPYYKLTMEQIRSFRDGVDVEAPEKNKLELKPVNDDTSSNGENQKDNNEPNASDTNGDERSGEDVVCSKIPLQSRSSADTFVLDDSVNEDTAQEGPEATEHPDINENSSEGDLEIINSQPTTPTVQNVLDDFATESEGSDREPQMQIVETVTDEKADTDNENDRPKSPVILPSVSTDIAKNAKGLASEVVEEMLLSEMKETGSQLPKNKALRLKKPKIDKTDNNNLNMEVDLNNAESGRNADPETTNSDNAQEGSEFFTAKDTEPNVAVETVMDIDPPVASSTQAHKSTQNVSNNSTDSVLPNNPEAFENKNADTQTKAPSAELPIKKVDRKRSQSRETTTVTMTGPSTSADQLFDKIIEIEEDVDKNDQPAKAKVAKRTEERVSTAMQTDQPSTSGIMRTSLPKSADETKNKNPCLKPVSLFAEQFNTTQYSSDDNARPKSNKQDKPTPSRKQAQSNEPIVLNSNSEDTCPPGPSPKRDKRMERKAAKAEKHRKLSNVFGFSNAGGSGTRKIRFQGRSKPRRVSHVNNPTESSDWSSDSEVELVSPPRARKNRQTRKYVKPRSARILSLEEDGGLFVMHNKKIYPVVKDGKIIKNYLTFLPDSGSEEEDSSFWKKKYIEEKKKADELKKLLEEAKKLNLQQAASAATRSPQPSTSKRPQPNINTFNFCKELSLEINECKDGTREDTIRFKYIKENEALQLEGNWDQIHPAFDQVVQLFNENTKTNRQIQLLKKKAPTRIITEDSSREVTPIRISTDPEVQEKVNKIESEIFKEIQKRDKKTEIVADKNDEVEQKKTEETKTSEDKASPAKSVQNKVAVKENETEQTVAEDKQRDTPQNDDEENKESESNLLQSATKRKSDGLNRESLSSTLSAPSPVKQPKKSAKKGDVNTAPPNSAKTQTKKETEKVVKRRTRQSKPLDDENASVNTRARRSRSNAADTSDTTVRYMLPPKTPSPSSNVTARGTRSRSSAILKKVLSPDSSSRNSIESTQGYQDSDMSPGMQLQKKKKKLNSTTMSHRGMSQSKGTLRRRSHPNFSFEYSSDSNSSLFVPRKNLTVAHSSNSDVYKSESYQVLLPQGKNAAQLQIITERCPISNELNNMTVRHFAIYKDNTQDDSKVHSNHSDHSNHGNEIGSSSNVSLPLSPELSIVENLSVTKDNICLVDVPTVYETLGNQEANEISCSEYFTSEADCSKPLKAQELAVTNNKSVKTATVSDSLLTKICNVNIDDTTSHSLDIQLRDLLLESAKKIVRPDEKLKDNNLMEVDNKIEKKTKSKKRCSTPRKKGLSRTNKAKIVEPLIEEECMESCSYNGRQSCPPIVQDIPYGENYIEHVPFDDNTTANMGKNKKKKDVIKVKILRPQRKSSTQRKSTESVDGTACTDSGINITESGVFLQNLSDSVDLIHNHSETCLHGNECLDNSIQFIDNSRSVISLSSSSGNQWQRNFEGVDGVASEIFSHDTIAEELREFCPEIKSLVNTESSGNTVYYSPLATDFNSSLITEDLSNEAPAESLVKTDNWYLLNEDDATSATQQNTMNYVGFGANLNQLFPIACAVPNLSTITELSRDIDDNSRKPNPNSNRETLESIDSQSLFGEMS